MTEKQPAANAVLVSKLAEKILSYCRSKPDVSFAELSRDIPGFCGEHAYGIRQGNVLLWAGMSLEAGKAMHELFRQQQIDYEPCHPLAYHIDGAVLHLPLVKGTRMHKSAHWLPVLVNVKGGAV